MVKSKASKYPEWERGFSEYWNISNDSERQQHLLDFFKECGVLDPDEAKHPNALVLSKIQLDKVIMFQEDLGERKVHVGKGFAKLRQCFLAESLYINGCGKELITKNLVTHSTYDEKEVERWRTLQRLGGKCVDFACIYTPVSKFYQVKNAKKKKDGVKKSSSNACISSTHRFLDANEFSMNPTMNLT